jgi:hypothetical protein
LSKVEAISPPDTRGKLPSKIKINSKWNLEWRHK